MGRPSTYKREIADVVCARLAEGESLTAICESIGVKRATFAQWVIDNPDDVATRYAHARDLGLDCMADDTLRIADTTETGSITTDKPTGQEVTQRDMTEHRRLRVDTRKWYLSKLAPKRYGDRLAMELSGPDGGPIRQRTEVEAAAELAALLELAKARADGTDLA